MFTIGLIFVGVTQFVVATLYGLQAYHKKNLWWGICAIVWAASCADCIIGEVQVWWLCTMPFMNTIIIFTFVMNPHLFIHGYSKPYNPKCVVVAEEAQAVVHGEVRKQKLWNTLRGWYYCSIASIYNYFNLNSGYWLDTWIEDTWIKGYYYSLYGYFPPKTVSWEDAKREFGLDIDDELDDNEDEG